MKIFKNFLFFCFFGNTNKKAIVISALMFGLMHFNVQQFFYAFVIGLILGLTQLSLIGVILFSLALVFQLITLPVEFNASRRAIAILDKSMMLYEDEIGPAKKVLKAAAMTYVAALAVSLAQLLRLIIRFGGRRND